MEARKVQEARALTCHARDLLRQQLVSTSPRSLCIDVQHKLRTTLQQLLPCLCIIRSYERQHVLLAMYELIIGAVGQVVGSLTGANATVAAEIDQIDTAKNDAEYHNGDNDVEASAALSSLAAPLRVGATAATTSNRASCAKYAPAIGSSVTWKSTYGCEDAILALRQATTLPLRHPSLFTGPRQPWRRLLLYGPPGTGKTRLAAATATEYGAVFLSVSSADLLSKWVGESEKQVRQAFAQAAASAPRCILFFDEVDALCSARGGHGESELARRLKTELLLHLQADLPKVTVLAATNLPWELDAAFLRRFDRFIHVGLPSDAVKRRLLETELRGVAHNVTSDALDHIVAQTDRFSVVDVRRLLSHAAMAPVTEWLQLAQTAAGNHSSGSEESTEGRNDGTHVVGAATSTAPAPLLLDPSPPQMHMRPPCLPLDGIGDTEVLGAGARSVISGRDNTLSSCSSPLPSSPVGPEYLVSTHFSSAPRGEHVLCRDLGSHTNGVPDVEYRHFEKALEAITATTSADDVARYAMWRCRSTGT
ncbi:hypothetical protein JKF63_01901 [Porcisia hertigi]|uniref:AAA+ ATPase domain-containing protein n=1 Tax=Porcisia hertigi TaxID=2761500 RepID=A0A836H5K9_9TRYP|nr:hypothetical protein JKF63_01901 [Porcisia hertigi]